MNPFKYGTTVSDEDFCPRPELEKLITKHVASKQNIHIEGDRRTGKTSLIFHVVGAMKKRLLIHFDFMLVKSADDIRARIVDGLSRASHRVGMFEKLVKKLAHLRPVVGLDPSTGEPTLSLAPASGSACSGTSLVELIEFGRTSFSSKNPVIFFDEFQDILKTPDPDEILAVLRGSIQHHRDCAYIYSGSSRSDMDSIFRHPDRPFYKSAIPAPVGTIDRGAFIPFLVGKFKKGKRRVSGDTIAKILDMAADNPGDAQEVCNCLWDVSNEGTVLSDDDVESALQVIFERESKYFEQVIDSLTNHQKKCLRGIASLDGTGIYSNQFFDLTGTRNPGSITRAVNKFQNSRIIHDNGEKYVFASPFLKLWLLRNPNL